MSFQRMIEIASVPVLKTCETAPRFSRSPSPSRSRSSFNWRSASLKPSICSTASDSLSVERRMTSACCFALGRISVTPVACDVPGRFVDVVADVVERASELEHVVAVEGCDKRPVEEIDQLSRESVAFVLEVLDVAEQPLALRKLVEQGHEVLRDLDGVPGRPGIQDEELALLGDEGKPRHGRGVFHASLGGGGDASARRSQEPV